MSGYSIAHVSDTTDPYAGTDVPGEFRSFRDLLNGKQLAVTLIRIPAHSDFEQGTGHFHEEIEELYILAKGNLTMRLGDDIHELKAGSVVLVEPKTLRSHRNESDEEAELWAISRNIDRNDATKLDDFWEASAKATQKRT